MAPRTSSRTTTFLHGALALAILVVVFALWRSAREARPKVASSTPAPMTTTPAPAVPSTTAVAPVPSETPASLPSPRAALTAATFPGFQRRPFAVAHSSGQHEWTSEDGRDPDAILEIAHNETEVQRLMEENPRIMRRQIVYRKEPAWVLVERAKASGEPLRRLIVPAFDGREVEIEVTRADLDPSGLSGTFAGRLPGRGQSLVTLAFKRGREAFTVMSPEDGTYLQGHPREPGEIIVTSFDPDKYQPLPGGEPIRMTK